MTMIIVSACLAGVRSRFDGTSSPCQIVEDLVRRAKALPLCPEQLGGLPTPRDAAERVGDKVLTKQGEDVTEEYRRGAEEILRIARLVDCRDAILRSLSPSCGSGEIYDGSFTGRLVTGDGVLAELLKANGIKVHTEWDVW